ncbi:alpha-mannosidase 2C1-like [Haliotis rubra]|uniref:alpha-mannosidase 2C1-like n=1 Tax=Haliotis rubra TaxID=36100 RepID=UPI001EE5B537|nr:alpha-mannosidase 2C1-like [Haliotis rubra]
MDQIPFKHRDCQLARIQKFLCHDRFDRLCLTSKLYPRREAMYSIAHAQAADDTATFAQAVNLSYNEVQVGQAFGPLWSKHWFRLHVKIPETWSGEEVRLVWNSGSECQVWVEGKPLQGLSCMKKRYYYTITPCVEVGALEHTIYIEMSVNGIFNDFNEAPPDFKATLTTAEIRVFDRHVFNVSMDLQVLYELAKDLPSDSCMSEHALHAANDVINACVLGTRDSYEVARSQASHVLAMANGAASHHIHAVGYANIDSAWLWPCRKTPMKCVSSWSTAFNLMEKYPFKMAFTQPQQLQWVGEKYPDFYNRVKYFISTGQLLPVGATWIEMDANLPNGECLLRQFLYGQRFLQHEFGKRCTDLWLLDSFGYSAQLPQIMKHCDVTRFVTIKLSWNSVNKFPHNTFWWEGLGGHRVLAHFPPGTNYHKEVTVEEVLQVEREFSESGRSNSSLFLFGHGNAGIGPSEEMLEKLQRMKNLNGLPGIQLSTPETFYESVEKDPTRLCTWVGELYLERHQGTYTSQAQVKKRNRRAEFLLREMDFWTSIAAATSTKGNYRHPGNEMRRIWKLLMLNQFHDVLPGTCHPEVYKDFHAHHDEIEQVAGSLCQTALTYILKGWDSLRQKQVHLYSELNGCVQEPDKTCNGNSHLRETNGLSQANGSPESPETEETNGATPGCGGITIVNSLSWSRKEVVKVPADCSTGKNLQTDHHGNSFGLVQAPGCGLCSLQLCEVSRPAAAMLGKDGLIHLRNDLVSATVDTHGRLVGLWKPGSGKNYLKGYHHGNQLVMHDDFPLYRDAWDTLDFNLQTRRSVNDVVKPATLVENGPVRVVVEVSVKVITARCKLRVTRHDVVKPATLVENGPVRVVVEVSVKVITARCKLRVTRHDVVKPATLVENGPVRVVVEVCVRVSETSHVTQSIILDTESPYIKFHTQVSWHECHKFLKVEFPTSMTSSQATYEIQFGYLQRPTHYNTSWDSAKYEVCGHKWADISEHGRGVALLNDCKYGYSCVGGTLRLSLLRSPTAPDTKCDIGDHEFTYAVMPYTGTFQDAGVIQEAYNLNSPLILRPSLALTLPPDGISYFRLDTNQVVLETVKVSEEDPRSLILRLYESFGGSVSATLSTLLPVWSVSRCNGLEEMLDDEQDVQFTPGHTATIRISLDPFQILSLIARF